MARHERETWAVSAPRGLTLIEVLVATALASGLALLVGGTLLAASDQVRDGTALQTVCARSRLAADRLAGELRGANFHGLDLSPPPPQLAPGFTPTPGAPLRYRVVSHFDPATQLTALSPTRASGTWREVFLRTSAACGHDPQRRELVLVPDTATPGDEVVLAGEIAQLRIDYQGLPAGARGGRLGLEVEVVQRDHLGRIVEGSARIELFLPNALAVVGP